MFAELGVELLRTFEFVIDIEGHVSFAGRKSGCWHIALAPCLIYIVKRSETDNRRSPHNRGKPGHFFVNRQRSERISTTSWIFDGGDESIDRFRSWFGLVFGHLYLLNTLV
jgi:hypothetical protein